MGILQNISLFSTLLPFALYFIFRKYNRSKELKVIFFYLLYSILNDSISWYLFEIARIKAYIVYDLLAIVEMAVVFTFLNHIIANKTVIKYLSHIFVLFLIYCLVDFFIRRMNKSFNSAIAGVEAILIIISCLYYFFNQLREPNTLLIYNTKNFWIVIAFLIYFSGTFFLYIYAESTLSNKLSKKDFRDFYIIINSSFIIMKNILLSIALSIKPEKPQESLFPDENNMSLNNEFNL